MPVRRIALVLGWALVGTIAFWLRLKVPSFGASAIGVLSGPIMGWVILKSAAGVAWPFAIALAASQYAVTPLYQIAFNFLGNSPDLTNWFLLGLTTLLAVPPAAVLARYSPRGWLWLITPGVAHMLSRAAYEVIGLSPPSPQGVPGGALAVNFAIALLDGCLLAYILNERMALRSK